MPTTTAITPILHALYGLAIALIVSGVLGWVLAKKLGGKSKTNRQIIFTLVGFVCLGCYSYFIFPRLVTAH